MSCGGYWIPSKEQKKRSTDKRQWRLAEARKLGTHTHDEWLEMLEFFNYCCVQCGRICTLKNATSKKDLIYKDHIVPLCKVGKASDSIVNLQPLCVFCNSSKSSGCADYKRLWPSPEFRHEWEGFSQVFDGEPTPSKWINPLSISDLGEYDLVIMERKHKETKDILWPLDIYDAFRKQPFITSVEFASARQQLGWSELEMSFRFGLTNPDGIRWLEKTNKKIYGPTKNMVLGLMELIKSGELTMSC